MELRQTFPAIARAVIRSNDIIDDVNWWSRVGSVLTNLVSVRPVGPQVLGQSPAALLARTEVFLSAGAIGSPKLLRLAGRGPEAQLNEFGSPIAKALPGVGANLQDHFQVRAVYKINKPISLNDYVNSMTGMVRIGLDYIFRRRGPMTLAASQVYIFCRTRPELACDACGAPGSNNRLCDCGHPGISRKACEAKGCCFDAGKPKGAANWCFPKVGDRAKILQLAGPGASPGPASCSLERHHQQPPR